MCEHLWDLCQNGSEEASGNAKTSLRTWIRGFQKNLPGHYVREEVIKDFLFPSGHLPKGPPQTSTPIHEVEEVMDIDEEIRLLDPSYSNADLGSFQTVEEALTSSLSVSGHPPPFWDVRGLHTARDSLCR